MNVFEEQRERYGDTHKVETVLQSASDLAQAELWLRCD